MGVGNQEARVLRKSVGLAYKPTYPFGSETCAVLEMKRVSTEPRARGRGDVRVMPVPGNSVSYIHTKCQTQRNSLGLFNIHIISTSDTFFPSSTRLCLLQARLNLCSIFNRLERGGRDDPDHACCAEEVGFERLEREESFLWVCFTAFQIPTEKISRQ